MNPNPLIVFTYNRPMHTQRTLAALARCARLDDCAITIFCDGLKHAGHQEAVARTREVVQAWAGEHGAQVIMRETNLGLKKSIETGVTEICQQYGRVIVLEDDLLVSPDFVAYMLAALDHYAADERVMQVSGYTFPFAPDAEQGALLLPLTTTWGWATWWRAWQHYDADPAAAAADLGDARNAHSFDLDGAYPYTIMLMQTAAGQVSSWGVLFWYAVWRRGGLVVYPRQSLVQNIGFDGSGVHSGTSNNFYHAIKKVSTILHWQFASDIDKETWARLCHFLSEHIAPVTTTKPSRFNRVIEQVREWLR